MDTEPVDEAKEEKNAPRQLTTDANREKEEKSSPRQLTTDANREKEEKSPPIKLTTDANREKKMKIHEQRMKKNTIVVRGFHKDMTSVEVETFVNRYARVLLYIFYFFYNGMLWLKYF